MRSYVTALCIALILSAALPSTATAADVEQMWGVGVEPFGLTVDPRDGTVYVAISNHENWYGPEPMWFIDPSEPWDPMTTPPLIDLPSPQVMSVLDTSLDRLFVTLTSATLGIVDVATRSLVATVPGPAGAGVASDPATHRVYVATISGLTLVDGVTGAVLARREAATPGDAWWHVAHDPVRHRVYVANGNYAGSPSVVVLDDADLSLVADISLPAIPRLAISVDVARGLVYVGGFSSATEPFGSLYAIDQMSLQVVGTVDVGAGVASPFSTTLVPDASRLYVSVIAGPSQGALVVVDTATFSVRETIPLPFQPGQSAMHPDGRLYVAGYDAGLVAALSVSNVAPTVVVSLSDTSPRTNDVLWATATGADEDGDALSYSFTFKVNGVVVQSTEFGPNTTSALDLSQPGHGSRGDVITVEAVASDGRASSAAPSATATVMNSAPVVSVTLSDDTPTKRDVLVAYASGTDADADQLSYTYTWTVGRKVRLVTSSTTPTSSFDLKGFDPGDLVTVSVVANDGFDPSATATASALIASH